jgi:hypothetical protein
MAMAALATRLGAGVARQHAGVPGGGVRLHGDRVRRLHPTASCSIERAPPCCWVLARRCATAAGGSGGGWSYRAASRRAPLLVAFATCLVKGSASDLLAQMQLEGRGWTEVNFMRNGAFALFSAVHLGCGQHLIYNVLFARVFGMGTDVRTVGLKVLADSLWHVPMVYLPLYYVFEVSALLSPNSAWEAVEAGLSKYREEAYEVLRTYWTTWPLLHAINFKARTITRTSISTAVAIAARPKRGKRCQHAS